jgi:uncharacterized protein (TIGR02147 family)
MVQIYQALDYRTWLRERSTEIKAEKPYFSYRFMASKLDMNAGYLARVFNGQSHLAINKATIVAKLFGLDTREAEYFAELMRFNRAKSEKEAELHFNRLRTIRGEEFRTLADASQDYYLQWHHQSMRTLLSIYPFNGKDFRQLAHFFKPALSIEAAKESVALLTEMNLVKMSAKGFYEVTDTYVSTGEKWHAAAIRRYQKKVTEMAAEAQDSFARSETDFSTLTLPFDTALLETVRERFREFRQEMIQLAQECEPANSVYQMNLQFYPAAHIPSKVKK